MIIDIKARRTGKTTDLIRRSAITGFPIIVHDRTAKENLRKMALEMLGKKEIKNLPAIYSCKDNLKGLNKDFYVDEVGMVLQNLLGVYVEIGTHTNS